MPLDPRITSHLLLAPQAQARNSPDNGHDGIGQQVEGVLHGTAPAHRARVQGHP